MGPRMLGSKMRMLLAVVASVGIGASAVAAVPVPEALAREARDFGRTRLIAVLSARHAVAAGAASAALRAEIARQRDAALASAGVGPGERIVSYDDLPLIALDATAAQLEGLARAREVVAIQSDHLLAPSLLETIPRVGANLTTAAGFTGAGAAVAVLDSGVDASHPFLSGRVVAQACFSAGADCPNGLTTQYGTGAAVPCTYSTQCFHGTHVAGIAAGLTTGRQGVAPGASIVAVQVFSMFTGASCMGSGADPCALAFTSDVISGMNWARGLTTVTLASVNLSLGIGGYSVQGQCDAAESAFKVAIDALLTKQILTFSAAGNDGDANNIDAPACISTAVAVGATDDSDNVWTGSNSGPLLDLLAPGWYVVSSTPGTGYASASGTSMATPHAAGAAAVLKGALPSATAAAIRAALQNTGVPILDLRNSLTRPRIAVSAALKSLAPAACYDGLDNDLDGYVDYPADIDCVNGADNSEVILVVNSCGFGPELALAVPLLAGLRRLARRGRR